MSSRYLQLFRSDLKLNLVSSLFHDDKKLATLRDELGSSGSTIIHALQDLEAVNLTSKNGKEYSLTSLGVLAALIIDEINSAVEVLEKFEDFWLEHDLMAIPRVQLKGIGALRDSVLIANDSVELDKVHTTFKQLLASSRRVRGVSPILHTDFIGTFQYLLGEGAEVDLIVTGDVLKRTMDLADSAELLQYVMTDKLRIYVMDQVRVALTVTENSFSLGLFTNDGNYDYSRDLVSNSEDAIEWGENLFQHYLRDAKRLDLSTMGAM